MFVEIDILPVNTINEFRKNFEKLGINYLLFWLRLPPKSITQEKCWLPFSYLRTSVDRNFNSTWRNLVFVRNNFWKFFWKSVSWSFVTSSKFDFWIFESHFLVIWFFRNQKSILFDIEKLAFIVLNDFRNWQNFQFWKDVFFQCFHASDR